MIKSLILFSFLINPLYVSLRVFAAALILSTYSLLVKINFLLRSRRASSLAIPALNAVTVATIPIHIDTSFSLMSPFLNTLKSSLLHGLPVPRSYLYLSSFPFRPYPLSSQLLHLNRYRFILVVRVPTSGLLITHLLWHPPPPRRSCRQPLIISSPFEKVLVPLVILILFIVSCLIIVYPHHILFLFPSRLLFLFLTLYMKPSLIRAGNRQ